MVEDARHRRPPLVPRDAVARPVPASPENARGVDYLVGDRLVARVYFHPTGAVDWETHYDDKGRMHGIERHEFENGAKRYRAKWVHGRQHGLQQQWDERGRRLVRTRFVGGTGTDLWFDCGRLAEERQFVRGERQGVERWWRDRKTVWHEIHFHHGVQHGPEREWDERGRLRRGFPMYFANGRRVSRRIYERDRLSDAALPEIRVEDNKPTRSRLRQKRR
jgi:antitoxin component YwqK of YwqJK toxin-antitoxin module